MRTRVQSIRIALLHTLLMLVVLLLVGGAILYFGSKQIKSLQEKREALKKEESSLLAKRNELPLIARALPFLLQDSIKLSRMFPSGFGDKELIDFLSEHVKAGGAQPVEITLGSSKKLELSEQRLGKSELLKDLDKATVADLAVIDIKMTIKGDYASLGKFLESLKKHGRFIRISSIRGPIRGPVGGREEAYQPSELSWDINANMLYSTTGKDIARDFSKVVSELKSLVGVQIPAGLQNLAEEKAESSANKEPGKEEALVDTGKSESEPSSSKSSSGQNNAREEDRKK